MEVVIPGKTLNEVSKILEDVDDIGSSTDNYADADWQELSTAVVTVVKDFGTIEKEIDVFETLKDPTILLDKEANYNIKTIASYLIQLQI